MTPNEPNPSVETTDTTNRYAYGMPCISGEHNVTVGLVDLGPNAQLKDLRTHPEVVATEGQDSTCYYRYPDGGECRAANTVHVADLVFVDDLAWERAHKAIDL